MVSKETISHKNLHRHFTVDEAIRICLLLKLSELHPAIIPEIYRKISQTQVLSELKALYSALAFLPYNPHLHEFALEGKRTNIGELFIRLAHNNPFPAQYFNEDDWNQLILKCLFTGLPLKPVIGLTERNNPGLVAVLADFIKERWSAHRNVNPEVWQLFTPYMCDAYLPLVGQMAQSEDLTERKAAFLLCRETNFEKAKGYLPLPSSLPLFEDLNWEKIYLENLSKK